MKYVQLSGPTTENGHDRSKSKVVSIGLIPTVNGLRRGKGIQIDQGDGKTIRIYLTDSDLLRLAALATSGVTLESQRYLRKVQPDFAAADAHDAFVSAADFVGELELPDSLSGRGGEAHAIAAAYTDADRAEFCTPSEASRLTAQRSAREIAKTLL
jgi:hypothetical protein